MQHLRRWLAIVYITLNGITAPQWRWSSSRAEEPFHAQGDHELMALSHVVKETFAEERSGKVALEQSLEQPKHSLGDDPRLWGATASGLGSARPVASLMVPLQQVALLALAIARGERMLTRPSLR